MRSRRRIVMAILRNTVAVVSVATGVGCAIDPAPRPHAAPRHVPEPETAAPVDSEPVVVPAAAEAPPAPPAGGTVDTGVANDPSRWFMPVANVGLDAVISRYGAPRDRGRRRHEGVDIGAPRGAAVVSPVAARVIVSGVRPLGGNVVVLLDLESEYEFVLSHLDTRLVQRGAVVQAGERIGTVGTTGNAAGGPPHLHFEVHLAAAPVDPMPLLGRMVGTRVGQ